MATDNNSGEAIAAMSRKQKRKLLKKEKRKQVRKEIAVREKEEEESRWNDSEVQCKLRQLEQEELGRMERDRLEFEERERRFLEALELKKKREQEEFEQEEERERERQKLAEEFEQVEEENSKEMDEGSDWEYVEEGPAEIIWQGNEIIVKKKRVKVPKKNLEQPNRKEDVVRPISNPLAPQSESFETYKSAQDILDTVAQQVPNFGTEQDKAHCPFHLKTGACRFGTRCSRVHFYPDKSCTMLVKNMCGGPGLTWEQDEGLEHTDEEIDLSFEEFYEDVHTEFLKFGEIMNFKVCRNGSPHLRGNVYVHYKFLESAVCAYHSTNGRYFAGKQVICEFVNVTRWKVAICGEFMKSRLKRCSRSSACNFIHCFRNPGGDYEWADWDRPPPRYWIEKMDALFGYEDGYNKHLDELNHDNARSATESIHMDANRRHPRSRSREPNSRHTRSHNDDDNDDRRSKGQQWRHIRKEREHSLDRDRNEEKMCGKGNHYIRGKSPNVHSDDDQSIRELRRINHERFYAHKKSHSRSRWHSKDRSSESDSDRGCAAKEKRERYHEDYRSRRRSKWHSNGRSPGSDSDRERSVKDGWERDHEDRTHSRQKKRDSCNGDETLQNDPEDHYHEDTLRKHHKCVHNSVKRQDDDFDTCSSDSHGDSVLKNGEGCHMKRRKTSQWSSNEMGFSDDDVGDGYDRCENEYYRHTKERSNLDETVSKKTDLSDYSRDFHRDKHGKRESSKHRKREKSHKSERRSSRRHRKDDVGSNVAQFGKEEGSEKIHKGRKESLWDQNKVEDHVVTAHEAHHERDVCKERDNPEKHGRLEDAEIDEGNGAGHTSQNTMGGERTGDGHLSRQEYSVEVEIEIEQACRRAALEKLQEKQLQKQLSSNCGNLKNSKTSTCNLEESVAIRMVDEDQNDSEAEPRKRRRI